MNKINPRLVTFLPILVIILLASSRLLYYDLKCDYFADFLPLRSAKLFFHEREYFDKGKSCRLKFIQVNKIQRQIK